MTMNENELMGIRVTVHRGTNQIGGCVTEYECRGFHLFVDYGEQLPGYEHTDLEIEGLTKGDVSHSALLITHYHGDHIGKVSALSSEIPVYMGKTGCEIYREFEIHMAHIPGEEGKKHRLLADRVGKFRHFVPGHSFEVGPFKIMPIVMDHSAFDAYAFKIEADGRKVFHTGDFRTHGFRSKMLPAVIEKYIGKVDCVVSEGTNIERSKDTTTKTEQDIKKEFMEGFKQNKYNVVYVSSMNIDRLFALYHAACSAGRMFILDEFAKKMMDAAANVDKLWGKSRFYHFLGGQKAPKVLWKDGVINDTFFHAMERHGYVLIARANDKFDELLQKMPSEGRKVYLSMWKGYVDNPESSSYNKSLAEAMGNDYVHIHTSGHCDVESMAKLFEMLKPKVIIPIHTNCPEKFAAAFPSWNVKMLADGEVFSTNPFGDIPVHEKGDTILSAISIAENQDFDDVKVSSVDEKFKCWKLDYKEISSFYDCEDAKEALKYVRADKNVLAFEIWEECDFTLTLGEVYRRDKTFYASLDSKCHFASKEVAMAIMKLPFSWYLVPVMVMEPATKEALKKVYDEGLLDIGVSDFDEFYEQYEPYAYYEPDMIVKPLVDIETFEGKVQCELVSARYLFPMDVMEQLKH